MSNTSSGRSPAASVAVVLAGVALAGSLQPWLGTAPATVPNPAASVLAAAAVLVLLARRYGAVPPISSLVAAVTTALVAAVAVAVVVTPVTSGGNTPNVTLWLPLAALSAIAAGGYAVADWRDVTASHLVAMTRATLFSFFIGVTGLFVGVVLALVGGSLAGTVLGDVGPVESVVLTVVFGGLGLGVTALGYLSTTDRGLEYVDVRTPTRRDVAYVIGGIVVFFGTVFTIALLYQSAGIPTADNSITEPARQGNPETLLWLVPLSFIVIGPSEELLFRNIIQKHLYGSFSHAGAIVIASAAFAFAHAPTYFNAANPVATLGSLVGVFSLSLVLGVTYERTGNVAVSAFIHGFYDAVVFTVLYVSMAGLPAPPAVLTV